MMLSQSSPYSWNCVSDIVPNTLQTRPNLAGLGGLFDSSYLRLVTTSLVGSIKPEIVEAGAISC